jgi:hypothetical protein
LSPALPLLTGSATSGKITQGALLKQWKESGLSKEAIIEKLYVRCLSRQPTESEKGNLIKLIADSPNEEQGLHDVFWAIINSREFIFNH